MAGKKQMQGKDKVAVERDYKALGKTDGQSILEADTKAKSTVIQTILTRCQELNGDQVPQWLKGYGEIVPYNRKSEAGSIFKAYAINSKAIMELKAPYFEFITKCREIVKATKGDTKKPVATRAVSEKEFNSLKGKAVRLNPEQLAEIVGEAALMMATDVQQLQAVEGILSLLAESDNNAVAGFGKSQGVEARKIIDHLQRQSALEAAAAQAKAAMATSTPVAKLPVVASGTTVASQEIHGEMHQQVAAN